MGFGDPNLFFEIVLAEKFKKLLPPWEEKPWSIFLC